MEKKLNCIAPNNKPCRGVPTRVQKHELAVASRSQMESKSWGTSARPQTTVRSSIVEYITPGSSCALRRGFVVWRSGDDGEERGRAAATEGIKHRERWGTGTSLSVNFSGLRLSMFLDPYPRRWVAPQPNITKNGMTLSDPSPSLLIHWTKRTLKLRRRPRWQSALDKKWIAKLTDKIDKKGYHKI
jgi:hypothetical protein